MSKPKVHYFGGCHYIKHITWPERNDRCSRVGLKIVTCRKCLKDLLKQKHSSPVFRAKVANRLLVISGYAGTLVRYPS